MDQGTGACGFQGRFQRLGLGHIIVTQHKRFNGDGAVLAPKVFDVRQILLRIRMQHRLAAQIHVGLGHKELYASE